MFLTKTPKFVSAQTQHFLAAADRIPSPQRCLNDEEERPLSLTHILHHHSLYRTVGWRVFPMSRPHTFLHFYCFNHRNVESGARRTER